MSRFDRLLPPLAGLVVFEAAFRHRSFTHAAEELFLSQATVSRRIKELEDDLGVALFERRRHNAEPTAAGHSFAHSVRVSLSELTATAEHLRSQAGRQDTLTVLCSLSLASALAAPSLAAMQSESPELRVQLLSGCEPIETSADDFDVAIQYGPETSERFDVQFLVSEAVYPVCASEFAYTLPRPLTPDKLATMPLLHVDYDDPTWASWPAVLAEAGVDTMQVDRSRVFDSYQICLDAAVRGDGLALGWERSVAPLLRSGDLVAFPELAIETTVNINAYIPKGRETPYVADLLSRITAEMGSLDSPGDE